MEGKRKQISILLYIFFIGLILIGLYQIATYGWQSLQSEKKAENLADQVVVWQTEKADTSSKDKGTDKDTQTEKKAPIIPEQIDFNTLQEQNADVVAWLYCPDTVINYPIVHATDNDKYLHKDLSLEYSKEGTLFVGAENNGDFSDANTIVYGHNMKNGSMFKTITEYASEDFYKEHPVMYLYTPNKRYEIRLIAGCVTSTEAAIYASLDDTKELRTELNRIYKKSTFSNEEDRNKLDKIITLSTCSYEYENARYVLIGKLVEW